MSLANDLFIGARVSAHIYVFSLRASVYFFFMQLYKSKISVRVSSLDF